MVLESFFIHSIEQGARNYSKIVEKQFGFRPQRDVTDAIFIVEQLQEKRFQTRKMPLMGWSREVGLK